MATLEFVMEMIELLDDMGCAKAPKNDRSVDRTVALWLRSFADVDNDDLSTLVDAHLSNYTESRTADGSVSLACDWFPKPAHLLRHYAPIRARLELYRRIWDSAAMAGRNTTAARLYHDKATIGDAMSTGRARGWGPPEMSLEDRRFWYERLSCGDPGVMAKTRTGLHGWQIAQIEEAADEEGWRHQLVDHEEDQAPEPEPVRQVIPFPSDSDSDSDGSHPQCGHSYRESGHLCSECGIRMCPACTWRSDVAAVARVFYCESCAPKSTVALRPAEAREVGS